MAKPLKEAENRDRAWPLHRDSIPCKAHIPFKNAAELMEYREGWSGLADKKNLIRLGGRSNDPASIKSGYLLTCCPQAVLTAVQRMIVRVKTKSHGHCWMWNGYCVQNSD